MQADSDDGNSEFGNLLGISLNRFLICNLTNLLRTRTHVGQCPPIGLRMILD
jgi:hypothetical protein